MRRIRVSTPLHLAVMAVWSWNGEIDQLIYGSATWTARTRHWEWADGLGYAYQAGRFSTDVMTGMVVMMTNGQIGIIHARHTRAALADLGLRVVS